MKAILRIPAKEQYGYIEVEKDGITIDESIALYEETYQKVHGGFGIEAKEFNAFLDQYLNDGSGNLEIYNAMSKEQQSCIQEIKKSMKRIKSRNGDKDEE